MSLRFRINLLITGLTVLFTAVLLQVAMQDTRRAIREEMEGANRVTLQLLSTVIRDTRVASDPGDGRRALLSFLRELGRVRAHDIELRDENDQSLYSSPPSLYKPGRAAPDWFTRLVQPELATIRLPLDRGHLSVTVDTSRSVLDAWDELKMLLLVVVAFLVAANGLVFFLVGRFLRPVQPILEGLRRMEGGDLAARLPPMSSPEFDAIGHTFNGMADALERSLADNRRLALVAQQSGDAIVILDLDGRVSFWNPAAARLFGHEAGAVTGQPASVLVPEDRRAEAEAHSRALRGREAVAPVETVRLTREGARVDVALSAAPLVDPGSDQVIGEIYALRDITALKRAREAEADLAHNRRLTQLIQARLEEERRSIARELHDELGQWATAVRTIASVIARKTEDSRPDLNEGARTIVDVAGRIYDTLHGIIRQLRPSALDHLGLRDTLEEAVGQWRALHPQLSFELDVAGTVDGLGEAVNITAYRIVQECLNNIVKHAGASRARVSVVVEGDGPSARLRVTVADDGRGLPAAEALHPTRFGLLGMRERAEGVGGTLSFSRAVEGGLVVTALLPLAGPPQPRAGPEAEAEHNGKESA